MRAFRISLLAALSSLALPAHADWLLSSFATRVAAGQPFRISLVRDADAADEPLPDRLKLVVETGERLLSLDLAPSRQTAGAAFRRDYVGNWPAGVTGPVVLRLADRASSRLVLLAQDAPGAPGEEAVPVPPAEIAAGTAVAPEPALTVNEPMYFLVGVDDDTARFQLSFKYRIFDPESAIVESLPALGGLHFGYTQTSLWDLGSDSKPFRDTSYRPSFFYEWRFASDPSSRRGVGARAGYEHESNGRDGESSRSIDTLFATVDWRFGLGNGSYVGVTPKVWTYLDRDENPDIYRYRGYGELGLRFGRDDGWLARLRLRRAAAGEGSTQLDLSYPLTQRVLSETAIYLHLQVFDGVGETLLDYNKSQDTQFRIGFSIQR
ncbi:phospholipase A [Aromatoleum sp.]|uniref:phospholipase A n=1 Tax=Aromatoleum sp. TaxID=2307007 RepID=UPI002FC5FF0F